MKYVIILYLCSFVNEPQCFQSSIAPYEFPTYYDCITQGYKISYSHLKKLTPEQITENKLAIKFECRLVDSPKINT